MGGVSFSALTASFLRGRLGGFTMDTRMMASMRKWPRKFTDFHAWIDRLKSSSCKQWKTSHEENTAKKQLATQLGIQQS